MKCFYLPVIMLALVTLMSACGQRSRMEHLLAYLDDPKNNLKQEIVSGSKHFTLQYLPTDMQVLSEFGNELSGNELKEGRERYAHYVYFRLLMEDEGEKVMAPAEKSHFDYEIMSNLSLVTNRNDTVPCVFYQPIATGSRSKHMLIVVFDQDKVADDFRFVYKDPLLGVALNVPFSIDRINNIPAL